VSPSPYGSPPYQWGYDNSDHEVDPNALVTLANGILTEIQATFAEYNVALPTRQYIYFGGHGSTVHDDEQLTIALSQIYSGQLGPMQQQPVDRTHTRNAWFSVELVRKIPDISQNGKAPTADQIGQKAAQQMPDAVLLFEAGLRACENYSPIEKGIVDVTAGPASGGLQAAIMSLITVYG
jgi:hypothetical protein